MLTQSHKKDSSGSAIKTTTSFAPGVKITYTKKPEPFGNQPHPHCEKGVFQDLMKPNYDRPFLVCSDQSNPCSFCIWDDVQPAAKPQCCHGHFRA